MLCLSAVCPRGRAALAGTLGEGIAGEVGRNTDEGRPPLLLLGGEWHEETEARVTMHQRYCVIWESPHSSVGGVPTVERFH